MLKLARRLFKLSIKDEEEQWRLAREAEINKFESMGVFKVAKTPEGIKVIPTRWVYTFKEDDLKGANFKARCVVQGFRQVEGQHFKKYRILSPVVDNLTIRILTEIATQKRLIIHHLDIKLAYLNATLPDDEKICVKPPPGYELETGYSWLLEKSVYGMKQAGFEWFECLKNQLIGLGFEQASFNATLFTRSRPSGLLRVALYVDDLFIVSVSEGALEEFKKDLEGVFDLKYFGEVSEYLGIEFKRTDHGYILSQKKYLQNLLEDFGEHGIRRRKTPITVDYQGYGSSNNAKEDYFFKTPTDETPKLKGSMLTKYQSAIGSINWACSKTRPDLAFAASSLAAKNIEPSESDFRKLLHCLGYIKNTLGATLEFDRRNKPGLTDGYIIETFSDASFAPEADVRLISGHAIYVNGNLISWMSKKQKNITKSTAASELVALSIAEDRMMRIREAITLLGYKIGSIRLLEDNMAVIAHCLNTSISHSRKMVDVDMKKIRERLIGGLYSLEYVNTEYNIADMFTKALPATKLGIMAKRLFGWVSEV